MPSQLAQTLQSILSPYQNRQRWVVALSGGLDSSVLLHAVAALDDRPELCALHIHHGLQAEADEWVAHCEALCSALNVSLSVMRVSVAAGAGPEASARAARYEAFAEFLRNGDVLLQAHHLDDQVETLFLRLLRGTGLDGMRGMPAHRALADAELLRPLLELSRAELENYAERKQLRWIEDPSNNDPRFDRNFLRQRVLPLIGERWPAYRETVSRFARQAGEASELLSRQLSEGLEEATRYSQYTTLNCQGLLAMDDMLRKHTLQQWLVRQIDRRLSQAGLDVLCREVLAASEDAEPCLAVGEMQVRRFRDRLFLVDLPPWEASARLVWDPPQTLRLPGGGELTAMPAPQGNGLLLTSGEVRFRAGGERCRPAGRSHSQTLKKLLQEYAVPPWLRDRLPIIYSDTGELAAVADLWVCEGYEGPGGWRLNWRSSTH